MIFSKRSHTFMFAAGILLIVTIVVDSDSGVVSPQAEMDRPAGDAPVLALSASTPEPDAAAQADDTPVQDAAPDEIFLEESGIGQWGEPADMGVPMLSTQPEIEAPASTAPEIDEIDFNYGQPMTAGDQHADF